MTPPNIRYFHLNGKEKDILMPTCTMVKCGSSLFKFSQAEMNNPTSMNDFVVVEIDEDDDLVIKDAQHFYQKNEPLPKP